MIPSYPSIYALGHRAVTDLFRDPVVVQEKVDGSQISFARYDGPDGPFLKVRSKGADILPVAPPDMFKAGVAYLQSIIETIPANVIFRGEYLAKPKHNALVYDRVPRHNIVLFDVDEGLESYVGWDRLLDYAALLDFETVPLLYTGMVYSPTELRSFLDRESYLGGQKVEGVVVKNYQRFTLDKKVMMAKLVSEAFKEVHAAEWKGQSEQADIVALLRAEYASPARWQKALIHLRERGQIEDSPRDIGKLIPEVMQDITKECEAEIKDKLFAWAWPRLRKGLTHGLPEWYKDSLLALQFTREQEAAAAHSPAVFDPA